MKEIAVVIAFTVLACCGMVCIAAIKVESTDLTAVYARLEKIEANCKCSGGSCPCPKPDGGKKPDTGAAPESTVGAADPKASK